MSKGPGRVQRTIIEAFEQTPNASFSVMELAARAYPGQSITTAKLSAVQRALQKLASVIGLTKHRYGYLKTSGWQNRWRKP